MNKMNEYMYDPCPKCRKNKVMELYGGWEPTKFCTEKYVYVCDNCGFVVKKLVDHSTREYEWVEVEFKR